MVCMSLVKPNIILDGRCIKLVNSVKYLGVLITKDLFDDLDINRHLRYLYCVGNTLRSKFYNCSNQVKNVLFRSYCMSMYSVHLWCKFKISSLNRVRIAYNNSFRILHNIPRQESARTRQIQSNIKTFDALIRNYLYSFFKRSFITYALEVLLYIITCIVIYITASVYVI